MKRRTLLRMAAGTGAVGSTMLSGCLGVLSASDGECDTDRWCYDVGGDLDAVVDGTVYLRERSAKEGDRGGGLFGSGPTADGQVVALDAESGDREWTYGETGRQSGYTPLTVADAVYFGHCGDDDCIGLYALERDGEERWHEHTGVGWKGPFVDDGTVYTATDGGFVQALDAATGETNWERELEVGGERSRLVDVEDVAYVATDSAIAALERADGTDRWRYDVGEPADAIVLDSTVFEGSAYVATTEGIRAVADGDERWRRGFEESDVGVETEIAGVAADRLIVLAETGRRAVRLYAFDLASGDRTWVSDPLEHPDVEYGPRVALHDEVVYVGTAELRALDAATGDERWTETLESGPVQSVTVVEDGVADDHAAFVHADGTDLTSFSSGGERTWEGSVPSPIRNYLVADAVIAATDDAVHALDRSADS